jgi:hypothetical protein
VLSGQNLSKKGFGNPANSIFKELDPFLAAQRPRSQSRSTGRFKDPTLRPRSFKKGFKLLDPFLVAQRSRSFKKSPSPEDVFCFQAPGPFFVPQPRYFKKGFGSPSPDNKDGSKKVSTEAEEERRRREEKRN